MRIISFTEKWDKLNHPEFTTFRHFRADKDWYVGEKVQVFYKNRSPKREKLGEAEIIKKEPRRTICSIPNNMPVITDLEAVEDGFENFSDMYKWLVKTYGAMKASFTMNKLTLKWCSCGRCGNDQA